MIRVNNISFQGNERSYLEECIRSGWVSSEGPFVKRFETEFAAYLGSKFARSVTNGSAALDVALAALRLGPGDEVILPTFTIISCVSAVLRVGATPILVDCDRTTWNMIPEEVESKITSRTKAIMAVHIYGLPCDLQKLSDIARKHSIFLIEDCAEILGQNYNDKKCGTFGDVATFSFYANKHVTCGEGGMVTTDNKDIADRVAYLRNLCFEAEQRFVHQELGWNYRMTNLQAAVALAQLEVLPRTLESKRNVADAYYELLEDIPEITLPLKQIDAAKSIFWVFGIVLSDQISIDARHFIREMHEEGVECRPFFWCMHEQPVFKNMGLFKGESYPNAELIARRGLYIPSGTAITENDLEQVATALKRTIHNNCK